jgi:Domain of unknown function (DUF6471)
MDRPKNDKEWAERTARYVKAQLKRHNVSYDELAERLKPFGYQGETRASIANKLARGTFPAPFLLATMAAIEEGSIKIEDV